MSDNKSNDDVFVAPLERVFNNIVTPFERFVHDESAGGLLLMLCTVTALIIANSPLAEHYKHILHIPIAVSIGAHGLEYSLHHWINDGLMALFFFVVGLEIKREVLVGELSDPRAAVLPILAALGGMLFPALIYLMFNHDGPGAGGWGIPMATDIAFAVGVLVLVGSRVPSSLLTFLVALAIVDDLGAVLVIAIFYTDHIDMSALYAAAALFAVLCTLNMAGVRRALPYFVFALLLWVAMLKSGIHATIAGVLAAWTIPCRPRYDPRGFSRLVRQLMDKFDASDTGRGTLIHNQRQRALVETLEQGVTEVQSPLQRLEDSHHAPVAFFIIPVFALANAGVPIEFDSLWATLTMPVTLGIMAGLIFGKLIGIFGVSWLAVKTGIAQLPANCTLRQMFGVSLLAAIGFTMSIFIAELGFRQSAEMLVQAKTGVLFASLLAGIGGYVWLRFFAASPSADTSGSDPADTATSAASVERH